MKLIEKPSTAEKLSGKYKIEVFVIFCHSVVLEDKFKVNWNTSLIKVKLFVYSTTTLGSDFEFSIRNIWGP